MWRANELRVRQFCFVAIALLVALAVASVSAQERPVPDRQMPVPATQEQVPATQMPAFGSPVPVTERLVPLSALQLPANTPQPPLTSRQLEAADFDHVDLGYLNQPLVEDWSSSHVVFSNPGTLAEARLNGTEEHWRRIVSDPRYRMQWMKRYGAALRTPAVAALLHPAGVEEQERAGGDFRKRLGGGNRFRGNGERGSMHGDWTVQLGGSGVSAPNNAGTLSLNVYPAKYTFAPIGAPNCATDYVVFPVNATPASSGQANLVGVRNLYSGFCSTGTVPTVMFAYAVGIGTSTGAGPIQNSPVLSLDGTKVAFVVSTPIASFHVLTIGTTGSNGTGSGAAVVPGSAGGNNALDLSVPFTTSQTDNRSSIYVDYVNDIAYVGDAAGNLHKFSPVFTSTTANPPVDVTTAGSGWPFALPPGGQPISSPVYESANQRLFVGGANGRLECVAITGPPSSSSVASCPELASIGPGPNSAGTTGPPVYGSPILDNITETVYYVASPFSGSTYVTQAPVIPFASRASVAIGSLNPNGLTYSGAFDNGYLTTGTGNMYFCGNTGSAPTLYQIPVSAGAAISIVNTGPMVATGVQTSPARPPCTPLTEVFNSTQGFDYLFLGVSSSAAPANCTGGGGACVMSFVLPTTGLPSGTPRSTMTTNLGTTGMSAIIIDNVSGTAGASQIYFGNLAATPNTGVQASQTGLQ